MGIGFTEIFVICFFMPLAGLPSIIAISTNHPQKLPIILVNILGLPVAGLGWFVAMVWCFIRNNEKNTQSQNEDNL